MGVQSVLGISPVKAVRDAISAPSEINRRQEVGRWLAYYRQPHELLVQADTARFFDDEGVKTKVKKFASIGRSVSLTRRLVDAQADLAYAVPPVRTLDPEKFQDRYASSAWEMRLNQKLDQGVHLAVASGKVHFHERFSQRLQRPVLDVYDASSVTLIPDPDDPSVPLAYIYDKLVCKDGKDVIWRVFWDDTVTCQFDETMNLYPFEPGGPAVVEHGLRRMPFVTWALDEAGTSCAARVEAHAACQLFRTLAGRLLKAQGFNQLHIKTDEPGGIGARHVMDEENAIKTRLGVEIANLQIKTDAAHYLAMEDAVKIDAAASDGVSRARLNAEGAAASTDEELLEKRAWLTKALRPVELDLFDVHCMISQSYEDEDMRIPDDGSVSMYVDFPPLEARVSRKDQLDIYERESKLGVTNVLNEIKRQNPEIATDEEAMAELERNIAIQGKWFQMIKGMNASPDATTTDPGGTAQANGVMGPMKRDGKISADELEDMQTHEDAGGEE